MIKFDSDSIYSRAVSRLQDNPEWKAVINNSVIDALLRANSETTAEAARYAEYLFKESKWDTAQNDSSILAMAGLLGYKPRRKVSAQGKIYISADPLIHRTGSTVPVSELEKLVSSPTDSIFGPSWKVIANGVSSTSNTYTIKDSKGNPYVALRNLSKDCTAQNPVTTIDVMQGKRKFLYVGLNTIRNTATQSKLDAYLYIPVRIPDCENASNSISRGFFKVYAVSSSGSLQEYRVVDTLLLSESTDYDVEVYNDLYSRDLFYLKFNADYSRGPVLNITEEGSLAGLRIDYVESMGSKGNVTDVFRTFTISDIDSAPGVTLYGVNLSPIVGGANAESAEDIKVNAPKHYIKGYTAGTRESYENVISNMSIPLNGEILKPTAVRVYGGSYRDANDAVIPATMVTFIAAGLDDYLSIDDGSGDTYEQINKYLNYYLAKVKSPQDVLRFEMPSYVAFTIGMTCRINKETVVDLDALKTSIRDYLDDRYGSSSSNLSFGRNIYPSSISSEIQQNFDAVVSTSITLEAVKKLNWYNSKFVLPGYDGVSTEKSIVRTIRIPFTFDSIFKGNQSFKGFRDYKTGASYLMRVDVLYKKPSTLPATGRDYNISIFVPESPGDRKAEETPLSRPFYCIREKNHLWVFNDEGVVTKNTDYSALTNIAEIQGSKMVYYKKRIYDDNTYNSEIASSTGNLLDSYLTTLGAIDDYLIYFNGDYSNSENAGEGFVEFAIDPIYMLLQSVFAPSSVTLAADLAKCPLSQLKCGTADPSMESTFKNILADYVDVYVSMIPNDPDLITLNKDNAVLYIDSSDETRSKSISNVGSTKLDRMISVDCEYV